MNMLNTPIWITPETDGSAERAGQAGQEHSHPLILAPRKYAIKFFVKFITAFREMSEL